MRLLRKQQAGYWDSDESIERYAHMKYELYDAELAFVMKAVEGLNKPVEKIRILDLGCGGGRTTIPLHTMGFQVVGIDIAPNLISALKKKKPSVQAEVGDASRLRWKEGTFDIVLFSHNSLDCMYPKQIRRKTLLEISRVLKPGGYFIFSSHVFNLIPFDMSVLHNIVVNISRLPKLLGSGDYYKERMGNGEVVDLYAASFASVVNELKVHGFRLVAHTRVIYYFENLLTTFIRSWLNWERYYLARKEK